MGRKLQVFLIFLIKKKCFADFFCILLQIIGLIGLYEIELNVLK